MTTATEHHKPMLNVLSTTVGSEFTWGPHALAKGSKMFSGAVQGRVNAGNGYTISIIGGCDKFYLDEGKTPEQATYEVAIMHTAGIIVDPFREGHDVYGYQTIEEVQELIRKVMALPPVSEEEVMAESERYKAKLLELTETAKDMVRKAGAR